MHVCKFSAVFFLNLLHQRPRVLEHARVRGLNNGAALSFFDVVCHADVHSNTHTHTKVKSRQTQPTLKALCLCLFSFKALTVEGKTRTGSAVLLTAL